MGEVAGLVVGGVSLLSLFDSCMNAFEYIESGKTYGREYQKSALKKSLLELRLARWAESIRTASNGRTIGTPQDAETVQHLLGEIQAGIDDTERVAKRYKPKDNAGPSGPVDGKEVKIMDSLATKVRSMALRRQKQSSFKQKTQWALLDQRKFKNLIGELNDYITELEQLFPAGRFPAVAAAQKRLAGSEATELIQPSEVVEPDDDGHTPAVVLEEATLNTDPALATALKEVAIAAIKARGRHKHIYGTLNAQDSVQVEAGDYVAPGMRPDGLGSIYGVMNASGTARIRYGDNYGGKSVYDD